MTPANHGLAGRLMSLAVLIDRVEQRSERRAGSNLAAPDQVRDSTYVNPFDAAGLEIVFRWPDAGRGLGTVDVVGRVRDPRCRLDPQQRPERAGTPAGFLLDLAGGTRCRVLARVGLADRDLPAPCAGDEPMPPQQQDPVGPAGSAGDDCASSRRCPDQSVLEVAPI